MLARKRSDVVYHAYRLGGELPDWMDQSRVYEVEDGFVVHTAEGIERAARGDWVFGEPTSRYYPKSAEAFAREMVQVGQDSYVQVSDPVECWLFDTNDLSLAPQWLRQAVEQCIIESSAERLIIHTSWGDQLAQLGQYVIIRKAADDIYACKLTAFERTYEVLRQDDEA